MLQLTSQFSNNMIDIFIIITIVVILLIIRCKLFPVNTEDYFNIHPPSEFNDTKYHDGYRHMKSSTVVFTGLMRDQAKLISGLKNYLSIITPYFKDYRILIVENDSKDKTRELLLDWAKEDPKVIILGCGINVDKCKLSLPSSTNHKITFSRIGKMAMLRNIYNEYIKNNLSDFDYNIILDMDIFGSAYIDGISDSFYYFEKYPQIDCISCNPKYNHVRRWQINAFYPRYIYYDPFALKLKDPEKVFGKTVPPDEWGDTVNNEFKLSHKLDGLLPVISAFAGLSICRISSIIKYDAKYNPGTEDNIICEHVPFFESMKNNYINPKMIYYIKSF